MKMVFLGPPGAGKGTMAVRVAEDAGLPHISTGDIFRYNIKNQTDLGKRVKSILDGGDLVPDELTIELVQDRLQQEDAKKGFILDGFPRTIPQADALASMQTLDWVINFELSDEEVLRRLTGRRVHPGSGRTYHIVSTPPKVEGKDDVTGEPLVQREDDKEEAIKNRLRVYREQTQPLIDYYRSRDMLTNLDASSSPAAVYELLKDLLGIG
ncbi:adenylate kinase [Alkalispirochaeta sphaeroplastigenens]|uniref:Adenylate kinase n=1 Tax=Alkalispirochaeta sphaeroplastigenens TaxID=1187066 RepID=A0A2S4K069_9SPIO|nr:MULTISPECIES: adenylate kinase [Alkalispirochaeta]POR05165.1 adenylate kinase [Alkalispirochaeta sphaeroplastigenens]